VLNNPEKHGNLGMFKISEKLIAMLNIPKDSSKVFGNSSSNNVQQFQRAKKTLCKETRKPRLLRIHFHTLRHWKATMEYHRTKDILHVRKLSGHKNVVNTLIYTQLVEFGGDEYCSAIANNVEEAKKLVEAGFEYVCSHNDTMLFRKRK
jgi:integrase